VTFETAPHAPDGPVKDLCAVVLDLAPAPVRKGRSVRGPTVGQAELNRLK